VTMREDFTAILESRCARSGPPVQTVEGLYLNVKPRDNRLKSSHRDTTSDRSSIPDGATRWRCFRPYAKEKSAREGAHPKGSSRGVASRGATPRVEVERTDRVDAMRSNGGVI